MSAATVNLLVGYGTRILGALILVVIGTFVARWAAGAVDKATRKTRIEETLRRFLVTLTRWLVMVVTVAMSLGVFGVQSTSIAAILGAASFAVGLAFQGTLSNFAAGIMLLVFRPFTVGQTIEVGGRRGKVDSIDLLFTVLDTPDNRRLILPNGQVFGAAIENVTFHAVRRADVRVGTAYGSDPDAVRTVLEAVVASVEGRVDEKTSEVVLVDLGASSVDWEMRVWCRREDLLLVTQRLRRDVQVALTAAGFEIPFPQLDVHLSPPPNAV